MFIKFNEGFESYDEGNNAPFLKEKEPFEVGQVEGERLLELKGSVATATAKGEKTKIESKNIFVLVSDKESAKLKSEQVEKLAKLPKAELVAKAENEGVKVVPDEMNRTEIAAAIVEENK